jgi:hypothetical protein
MSSEANPVENDGLGANWIAMDAGVPSPVPPPTPVTINPYLRATAPLTTQLQPDLHDQQYPGAVPTIRIMPASVTPQANAAAQSVVRVINASAPGIALATNNIPNASQVKLNLVAGANMILSADSTGDTTITGTAGGDGLIHGSPYWDTDTAYFALRDDFAFTPSAGTTSGAVGRLGWQWGSQNGVNSGGMACFQPPYFGSVTMAVNTTANASCYLQPAWMSTSNPDTSPVWPLFDYPNWQMSWVFMLGRNNRTSVTTAFTLAKTSFYIGLFGWDSNTLLTRASTGTRPFCFAGLRYDADPGTGALAVTSVATSSGGTAVYTGTFPNGSTYTGKYFSVSGFVTHSSNNGGPWVCSAGTSTTLTLANASAVAETATASTHDTALSDTTFKFECVSNTMRNSYVRNNLPGNVTDTLVTPAENIWYRVDMLCTAAGQVQMCLSGNGATTGFQTVNVPQYSFTSATVGFNSPNGPTSFGFTSSGLSNLMGSGEGTKLNASSWAGGTAGASWTRTLIGFNDVSSYVPYDSTLGSTTSQSTAVFTFNPGMYPGVMFGNDSEASPAANRRAYIGYWSLVWNPEVGGGTGTPNANYARYWQVQGNNIF